MLACWHLAYLGSIKRVLLCYSWDPTLECITCKGSIDSVADLCFESHSYTYVCRVINAEIWPIGRSEWKSASFTFSHWWKKVYCRDDFDEIRINHWSEQRVATGWTSWTSFWISVHPPLRMSAFGRIISYWKRSQLTYSAMNKTKWGVYLTLVSRMWTQMTSV